MVRGKERLVLAHLRKAKRFQLVVKGALGHAQELPLLQAENVWLFASGPGLTFLSRAPSRRRRDPTRWRAFATLAERRRKGTVVSDTAGDGKGVGVGERG